jgi:hypothetical protein
MTPQEISRKTYSELSSKFYLVTSDLSGILAVNKIWNLLYYSVNIVRENSALSFPPVNFCTKIDVINQNTLRLFQQYISNKINVGVGVNIKFNDIFNSQLIINLPTPEKIALLVTIPDDEQNKFIYRQYISSIESALNDFLNSDQELFLINNKNSLEALWGSLIVGLETYRKYFQPFDIVSTIIDYNNVQNILRETIDEQKNSGFSPNQALSQSITLASRINVESPVAYNNSESWKTLFNNVHTLVLNAIITNKRTFMIRNSISSSLDNVLSSERNIFTSKENSATNYSFEASEHSSINKQIKLDNSNISTSNWQNNYVTYYNSRNAFTRSKIASISTNNSNKILTLDPYNGISENIKTFTFPTIGQGIINETDFPATGVNLTRNSNNSDVNLFSLTITSGSAIIKTADFKLKDNLFENNYLKIETLKNNFSLKYINLSRIKTFETTFPANGITFNKVDNNNIILFNSKLEYVNSQKNPTINQNYILSSNIFNTNLFSKSFSIINSEFNNTAFEVPFQSFYINKNNIDLFTLKINYKNSNNSSNYLFKLDDTIFNTNRFLPQSVNSPNSKIYWQPYYDDISFNNGIGIYQGTSQNISLTVDQSGEMLIDKSSTCSGNVGFSNIFYLKNNEKNLDINFDFDYYISSSGDVLSQDEISFKIISLVSEDINDVESVYSYSLPSNQLQLDTQYSAHFTFKAKNYTSYRILINFNKKDNKNLKIKFKNFYVGITSLNSTTLPYTNIDDFLNDYNLYNYNTITSSQFYLNKKNINILSFYTELLNNNLIESIEFINVNNNLNWFNNNSSILNNTINNPLISVTKSNNPNLNFTILKKLSNVLGGKIYADFFIKPNQINLTLNVKFKYQIFNSSFSTSDLTFKIVKSSNNTLIKSFSIDINNTTVNNIYSASFDFIPNESTSYLFLIQINDQQSVDINIKLSEIYIGTEDFSETTRTYKTVKSFLEDYNLYNRNNNNLFTLSNVNDTKIGFYSNVFENINVKNFSFININSNLEWLVGQTSLTSFSVNPKISFDYDNQLLGFNFNKNNSNLQNSYIYNDFIINQNDTGKTLNFSFTYNIKSNTFKIEDIQIEIYALNNGIEALTAIKTWQLLENLNRDNNFSGNFSTTTTRYYRLKIKVNSNSSDFLNIQFKNFYIGITTFLQNSITYTNPLNLINHLYLDSNFINNNFLVFSFSGSSPYKIKFTSEPFYLGSKITYTFTNVNNDLKFLFGSSISNSYSGVDPVTYIDSGYEKKYYDSFITLLKRIFSILNSYAFARLFVPEAFNEDEDFFNTGVNIPFSVKRYFRDLLDETISNLTFEEIIKKDPRSNFLQKPPDKDFTKEVTWRQGIPSDVFNLKELAKFKNTLSKIKTQLNKVKSILEAIKSFISILDQLIELGEDILGTLLDQIIKQLTKIVDNIASTGFYWLPVIEYYALNFVSSRESNLGGLRFFDKYIQDTMRSPYQEDESAEINNGFLQDVFNLSVSNSQMVLDDLNVELSQNRSKISADLIENNLFFLPFRSTTYEEFMQVIIDGLSDPYDLPELGLSLNIQKKNPKDPNDKTKTKQTNRSEISINRRTFRPGAPKWGVGSQSSVVVIAINLPAFEDLTSGITGFAQGLLNILKPIEKLTRFTLKINKEKSWKERNQNLENDRIANNTKIEKNVNDFLTNFWNVKVDKNGTTYEQKWEKHKKEYEEFKTNKIPRIKYLKTLLDDKYFQSSRPPYQTEYNNLIEVYKNFQDAQTKFNEDFKKTNAEVERLNLDIIQQQSYYEGYITKIINFLEGYLYIKEVTKKFNDRDEINSDDDDTITELGDFKERLVTQYESWWDSLIVDDALNERGGFFSGYRSKYPDFYGITVGSVFPFIFSAAKGLLQNLKKFNENESTFSLSDEFELLIAPIEDYIEDIEGFIYAIDSIIDFIDALTKINISYLTIKTGNGVADIINQLQNATGFPNEDKRQIILGGLLGAGYVDPDSGEFDLSGYYNEAAKEFQEDAKDLFNDLKLSNEEKGIDFLNKLFGSGS